MAKKSVMMKMIILIGVNGQTPLKLVFHLILLLKWQIEGLVMLIGSQMMYEVSYWWMLRILKRKTVC